MPTLAERNRANREKRKEAERKEAAQKYQKTSGATADTKSSGNGNHDDLPEILDHIDVSDLGHDEWMKCGTALKASGIPFEVFDDWSSRDTRAKQYHGTEFTRRQWDSFDANCGLTSGYIVTTAEKYGYEKPERSNPGLSLGSSGRGEAFDFSDVVTIGGTVVDASANEKPKDAGADCVSTETSPVKAADYDSFFRSYDSIATQKKRAEFDWLMPGIVARGLLTLLTASAGVGKTDTLYQMFDAAVSGGQWLAYRFDRKLSALYVDPEMDEQGTDARFYDIREERKTEYSPNPDYRRDIIQYLSLEPQQRAKIDTIAKLIPFLRGSGRRFDLIIIDSIAALMPKDGEGSENDNLFVRNQLESLASFAKDMGAGVVVSHHTGKAVGQGLRNGNAARGASAWKDVPSVVMEMHPLSTRKSKEAQIMIESLSVERWDYVFRRNVRRFPQPIRLLYRKNRYTAHLPQLDMLYRYPLHIVKDDYWDIQAILRDCKIAADPAEAAAREKQERAKERVSDEAKAILAIIEDVHAEGLLATCENVYPRFSDWRDENGYDKELSLEAFKKACTPSGRLPFTKDPKTKELTYGPDESETEADS